MVKRDKNGRCRQVYISIWATYRWPLVAVDRWSLFRGSLSTKIASAGFWVVIVDRWSLFGGGRYHRFDCIQIFKKSVNVLHWGNNTTFGFRDNIRESRQNKTITTIGYCYLLTQLNHSNERPFWMILILQNILNWFFEKYKQFLGMHAGNLIKG